MLKEKKTKGGSIVELPLISHGENLLIDARLLHNNLEVGKKFSDWIKTRIEEFGFESGKDFFPNSGKTPSLFGGRPKMEYHLTLDMAKELAMLERNEVGRQIRRYFIAMEKKARGATLALTPSVSLKGGDPLKGMEVRRINDRKLVPYTDVLRLCGYRNSGSASTRKARYWMHFVKEGSRLWITEEFAIHLYTQRMVFANREALKSTQPVIPIGFGDLRGYTKTVCLFVFTNLYLMLV